MAEILETTPAELRDWFAAQGLPAYRAGQVRKWLFAGRADSFDEMTDLPAELRRRLAAEWTIWTTRIAKRQQAVDGSEKLLLELHDAEHIECVLLRDDKRIAQLALARRLAARWVAPSAPPGPRELSAT